jgi:hypothetical protein
MLRRGAMEMSMKVELAILAQSIERIEIELQRCRACLADLLAESIQSTNPPAITPPPIAQPRQTRTRLYGSGELARAILAVLEETEELSIREILRVLRVEKPGTQMGSLRPCLSNLVGDGLVLSVRKGVYRLPERRPHLSVVQS